MLGVQLHLIVGGGGSEKQVLIKHLAFVELSIWLQKKNQGVLIAKENARAPAVCPTSAVLCFSKAEQFLIVAVD